MRWIVGPVMPSGLKVLRKSIHNARQIYQDRFDYLLCYNQISPDKLKSFDIELHQQDPSHLPVNMVKWDGKFNSDKLENHKPRNCWKLCQLRMRPDDYEIILDNDLFFMNDIFHDFLNGKYCLTTEAMKRSYGRFSDRLNGLNINTGLVGFPPGFHPEIPWHWLSEGWQNYFDEQAMLAFAIQNNVKLIERREICYGSKKEWDRPVHHYVGVNYLPDHQDWANYERRFLY